MRGEGVVVDPPRVIHLFVLLSSQVVLWDISTHVEQLQGTRTSGGKNIAANTNALVSTNQRSVLITLTQSQWHASADEVIASL